MATPRELLAVADLLAGEDNSRFTAEQMSEQVWEVVDRQRRRRWRYALYLRWTEASPWWSHAGMVGPYHTLADACKAATDLYGSRDDILVAVLPVWGEKDPMEQVIAEPLWTPPLPLIMRRDAAKRPKRRLSAWEAARLRNETLPE